jgi:hypothetical protein
MAFTPSTLSRCLALALLVKISPRWQNRGQKNL